MGLEEIKSRLSKLPTIMNFEDEIDLVKDLMKVPMNDLNEDTLEEIVGDIEDAHTDNFFNLDYENEGIFLDFVDWLYRVNQERGFKIHKNLISTFSITYDEIKEESERW
jgi:hypothetical protein